MRANQDDLWVLEWRIGSNSIHARPLSVAIGLNRLRFDLNASPSASRVPIFVGTKQQVESEANKVRAAMIKREQECAAI